MWMNVKTILVKTVEAVLIWKEVTNVTVLKDLLADAANKVKVWKNTCKIAHAFDNLKQSGFIIL